MGSIEEAQKRIEILEERERKQTAQNEKELKLPFYLRIQEEGWEEVLKRVEAAQQDSFFKNAHLWKIPKDEVKELFQEFMTEFLKGKSRSAFEFLTNRGFKKDGH